jgi:hypothetical protein
MLAGRRSQLLHEFAVHDGVAVIANARCLTEGIDVPTTDTVVFIDPRQSKIDIVQAVGRAIRSAPNKSFGTIVVPLVFREGESPDDLFDSSRFAAIGDVLRALRAHDERLSEALDQFRLAIGERKPITTGFLGTHLVVDIPSNLDAQKLAESISVRLVKLSTRSAWEYVGILQRYVVNHSWFDFNAQTTFEGYPLGYWVTARRMEYRRGKLEKPLVDALEAVRDWTWDPYRFVGRRPRSPSFVCEQRAQRARSIRTHDTRGLQPRGLGCHSAAQASTSDTGAAQACLESHCRGPRTSPPRSSPVSKTAAKRYWPMSGHGPPAPNY